MAAWLSALALAAVGAGGVGLPFDEGVRVSLERLAIAVAVTCTILLVRSRRQEVMDMMYRVGIDEGERREAASRDHDGPEGPGAGELHVVRR